MSEFIKQKQVQGLTSDLAAKALDTAVVKKANNLSDVNATSARTNLDVFSKTEVQNLVAGATDAYSVADTTAKNALTGLNISDRVFVTNDGDSKWALYIVTAVTNGNGSTSTFSKIADEDLFTNAISKEAIKSAYESNSNTNAYTNAEKSKLAFLGVTQAVNLDQVESDTATALSNAATAQSTANSATTLANTAQSTANNAQTAASDAQTTADNAQSTADSAQATATNALNTANAKEESFTEVKEDFNGIVEAASTPVQVDLSNAIAGGFAPVVFFNGLLIKTIAYTPGEAAISYTVPYTTEVTDTISVIYAYR